MDKLTELTKAQKSEDKLLEAKIADKIKFVQNRNRFVTTDFLDMAQKSQVKEILEKRDIKSYEFFGGFPQAERTMLIIYPEEFMNYDLEGALNKLYSDKISVIRITLPKEQWGTYEHRNYLGALIKLGLKREKIGDIIVREDGADIIVSSDIEDFLLTNLKDLTRFQSAKIEKILISDISVIEEEPQIIKINVPSMRLDCIVGELARCSRSNASILINTERVFVDFKEEIRGTRQIKENEMITIRGKGRFKILRTLGNTRSGRINLEVQKWWLR